MLRWQAWKSDETVKLEPVPARFEADGAAVSAAVLEIDSSRTWQTIKGFGGAFNEIGWDALQALPAEQREKTLRSLFDAESGCGFSLCRTPVGASDFARDAYSLNDVPEDYEMEHFSIERDRSGVIPYIRSALAINPDLQLWASPWSPPWWMKTTGSMCAGGELIDRHEILRAYALYLLKYVQAYEEEGIPILGLCPQNETDVVNHYPTATLPEALMQKLLRAYLIPLFMQHRVKTELWLGTIRMLPEYASAVLADPVVNQFVKGIGYQYSRGDIVGDSYAKWPEKTIFHTESPCHNGANSWDEAKDIFADILMYLNNGAVNYCYWNMILNETGLSSWDWKQNSLITVNRETGEVRFNHEYYAMMHFSRYVKPGARRIGVAAQGRRPEMCAAFRNPDGQIVVLAGNFADQPVHLQLRVDGQPATVTLDKDSIYTLTASVTA